MEKTDGEREANLFGPRQRLHNIFSVSFQELMKGQLFLDQGKNFKSTGHFKENRGDKIVFLNDQSSFFKFQNFGQ